MLLNTWVHTEIMLLNTWVDTEIMLLNTWVHTQLWCCWTPGFTPSFMLLNTWVHTHCYVVEHLGLHPVLCCWTPGFTPSFMLLNTWVHIQLWCCCTSGFTTSFVVVRVAHRFSFLCVFFFVFFCRRSPVSWVSTVRHDITEILLFESGVKHHNRNSCISNVDIIRFSHMFVVVASLWGGQKCQFHALFN